MRHDEHYRDQKVQAIDVKHFIHSKLLDLGLDRSAALNIADAVKYIRRAGEKEGEPTAKDLDKAVHYIYRAFNECWPWDNEEQEAQEESEYTGSIFVPEIDWDIAPDWATRHRYGRDGQGYWASPYETRTTRYEKSDYCVITPGISKPVRLSADRIRELEVIRPNTETKKTFANWNNAPGSARYHAIDKSGRGCFFESKPEIYEVFQVWGGAFCEDSQFFVDFGDWRETLEERPKD